MSLQKNEILDYLRNIKPDYKKSGIEKLALFGSFAREQNSENSDVDVAIQLKSDYLKTHDVWEYFTLLENIKKDITKKFNKKIDIFDLDSSSEIKEHVLSEVLYV
ncbi:MAG: nucleotidyltransferase domain-containing protein [Campylobacterota bacterium]|nr:nucleotidyltransferase domain-containing protein [Campylobacterota bacterium]